MTTYNIGDTGFCYESRNSLKTLNIIILEIIGDIFICETSEGYKIEVYRENFVKQYFFGAPRIRSVVNE